MTLTGSSRKGGALTQFRQVYCWQLKKNRILAIVYGALALFCTTIVYLCRSIGQYNNYFNADQDMWGEMTREQLRELFSQNLASILNQQIYLTLIPLSLLFLVVFSVSAFGYMHRRRSVDLFHALPVRRTPLLLGNLAAGYTILVLVVAVNSLLCGLVSLALGAEAPFTFPWLLAGIGYQLLLLAAALVLTLFLLVASGTIVNAVLSGILLCLGWPILCYCGAAIIQMTLPGSTLATSATVATALVPYLALFLPFLSYDPVDVVSNLAGSVVSSVSNTYGLDGGYQISPLVVVWWCAFTVLLLAASILIYRGRKSECAENNFSFPALRTAIQFLVSGAFGLGCGLVFGEVLQQNWVFFLAVVAGSAVAHTVSQILWVKGIRRFKKSLPVFGVLVACQCVFFVGLATGGLGYVSRIPDPTQVKSITIEMPDYYYDDSKESYLAQYSGIEIWGDSAEETGDSEYLEVEKVLTTDTSVKAVREMHQAIINQYSKPYLPFRDEESSDGYVNCVVHYQLSDGKMLARTYQLPADYTDDTGKSTVREGDLPVETLKKMAAVIALDEYQAYGLYQYQEASQIASVSTTRLDSKGEYNGDQILDQEQKEKLWSTFRKELESDQFRYTAQDSSGVTFTGQTSYYINMESSWQIRQWPDALRELVMDQVKAHFSEAYMEGLNIENGAGSTMQVPENCTQTRKLIEQYIGDNVEYTSYDEEYH